MGMRLFMIKNSPNEKSFSELNLVGVEGFEPSE